MALYTMDVLNLPRQDKTAKILIAILIAVVLGSWATMIWGALRTYRDAPPIPQMFIAENGTQIMSADDIIAGKAGFQKCGMMDYGSIYGMGSYFGIDYTAQYLVELAQSVEDGLAQLAFHKNLAELEKTQKNAVQLDMQTMLHNVALTQGIVTIPDILADAIVKLRKKIAADLLQNDPKLGWTKAYALSQAESLQTADFLLYSSLTTVAKRPGTNHSWTSNWPPEPLVDNKPMTGSFTWTWASLTILFFAIGVVVVIFRLFIEDDGMQVADAKLAKFHALAPSQNALSKYFVVVAALLLIQILAGSLMAHAYAERESFYGFNLAEILPFSFLRSIHLQTPIAWIGLGWIGTALFLAPIIGGGEPKGQKFLVNLLLVVTVLVVGGAVLGNYFGTMGLLQKSWFWFGNQGLSYLELGRFWQIAFFVGLLAWSLIMLRTMWPTLKSMVQWFSPYSFFRIEHLIWYSSLGIAFIYAFGMIPLTKIHSSFTLTDYWRWWVVHLWVEWAFELFSSAIIAYFLMATGLISRQFAERAILFEWILILGSGILGTGHHLYWAGEPDIWISIGSVFSFLEVLPLFLMILEAITQYLHLSKNRDFHYRLAFLYILGSAFWNFVGAGVFGGATINAPLVNYYEHGTFLTLNHAHTAMFGAFGLLALGLIYLALRYMFGDRGAWSERAGIWAFWLYNLGLVLWIVLNFFPIGWPQLIAAYEKGFAYARSIEFYDTTLLWQWLRLPGDVVFAIGALLMAYDFCIKAWILKKLNHS